MKIAVLGSASSSLPKAPFQNQQSIDWAQGKAPNLAIAHAQISGEFDIWGCSPGCWAVAPRATRWFEVHRWEPGQPWFSPEYCQFLRTFKGPVYTGARIPEIPTAVVYPIERIEEKFSSYNLTSSLALMLALAIDTIEQIREARALHKSELPEKVNGFQLLPSGIDPAELEKDDNDDVIGLWGVDMAAADEYAYQRPGCQNLVLEAGRRGIGIFLPPESDLMRPMPVYGISEWDHSYIKLTSRARELSGIAGQIQQEARAHELKLAGLQGEQHALNYFVSTWTSPYGMVPGAVMRQAPGTGMGSGITSFDSRPIERMTFGAPPAPAHAAVAQAMAESPDAQIGRELMAVLSTQAVLVGESPVAMLRRIVDERNISLADKAERAARPGARPARKKAGAKHRR